MAYAKHSTPRDLARINPSWTPAVGDLGMLAKFFERRDPSALAQAVPPRPAKPTAGAALELV